MYNIKNIKNNYQKFNYTMQKREVNYYAQDILALYFSLRKVANKIQKIEEERNAFAKLTQYYKNYSKEFIKIVRYGQKLKLYCKALVQKRIYIKKILDIQILNIPNILDDNVPIGSSDQDNNIVRVFGTRRAFTFTPKSHLHIGKNLRMLDIKSSAKISGSKFIFLRHHLARLERALVNFMLDIHINEYSYLEISPPVLVTEVAMLQVGQLPKFSKDSFKTTEGFRLIPTAEVPLISSLSGEIILQKDLPIRLTASTLCFRSEAGHTNRDIKGLFRLHQFTKVELVSMVLPKNAEQELERTVNVAESILQKLELPYRVVLLCSSETGFCARKTYDIEMWIPSQSKYYEVSSCSDCGDFQSIRMNSRYKCSRNGQNYYPHTLNGSSLAVGRTMIGIIENYQQYDGSIIIPKVLRPYMDNLGIIRL